MPSSKSGRRATPTNQPLLFKGEHPSNVVSLIDTHLHLDAREFDSDRAQLWSLAQHAGVKAAVVPAVAPDQWPCQWEKLAGFPGIFHAWGVHPCFVDAAHAWAEAQTGRALTDEEAASIGTAALAQWIAAHGAVAIGEIGLDRFVDAPAWSRQQIWFEAQLALAERLHLPVLCHARRAVEEVRIRVRRRALPGGILHAFNGSLAQATDLIHHGFALGFGGAMTYERAHHLHRLLVELPLHAIVLETDGPDIPPVWAVDRPLRRSEPADVLRYAHSIAQLRQISIESVAQATTATAQQLLQRALT